MEAEALLDELSRPSGEYLFPRDRLPQPPEDVPWALTITHCLLIPPPPFPETQLHQIRALHNCRPTPVYHPGGHPSSQALPH